MNVQIVGTMLDPSGGEPAGGAMIQFIALAQYGGVPKGAQSTQTTSATGEYDFPLNYGRYSLAINHSGRFVNQAVSVTVNEDSPPVMDIDLLLESSVPLTPSEIKYVEELVEQAEQAALSASDSASQAGVEVINATNQANIATNEAARAKSEADRATEVTGLDTVEQAVDLALSKFATIRPDASGHMSFGKHGVNHVNEGLTASNVANRFTLGGTLGVSETNLPVLSIIGELVAVAEANIDFPDQSSDVNVYGRVDIWGYEYDSTSGALIIRTIAGSGNGDWNNTDCTSGDPLQWDSSNIVKSTTHNANFVHSSERGVFEDGQGAYFLFCGARPVLNKASYHPSHNDSGSALFSDGEPWYSTSVTVSSRADCFTNPVGGSITSNKSGHPDGLFYDKAYTDGMGAIIDWRLPAVANGSPEEAAKVEAKVENKTYRGLEKLVRTTVTTQERGDFSGNIINADVPRTINPKVGDTLYLFDSTNYNKRTVTLIADEATNPIDNITVYFDAVVGTRRVGDPLVFEVITNLSVSGEFNTKMVIADPANILLTDALKGGWLGTWCPVIPDGTLHDFALTRESLSGTSPSVFSTDNGVSWTSQTLTIDGAQNAILGAGWSNSHVFAVPYKAFAKQAKPSTSKPVYNGKSGLLGVTVTQSYDKSVLAEAVAGVILKSDASGIVTEQSRPVKFLVDDVIERITSLTSDMVAPTNSSQAIKIAIYQISENGQVSLGFIANTMTHNGTDWGELDEIIIPFGDLDVDTFNDANEIPQLAYSTMTALPMGWTSNHARAGVQVPGVDL